MVAKTVDGSALLNNSSSVFAIGVSTPFTTCPVTNLPLSITVSLSFTEVLDAVGLLTFVPVILNTSSCSCCL